MKCPLSSRQWKNKKILSGIPPCCAAGWNFSRGSAMKFHRCHASESLLVTLVVVKIEITLDCRNQIVTRSKLSEIVHFRFENTPKSLHWTVVNASANAWHTLSHIGGNKFVVKAFACVLKPTVAMEQRMCIRIRLYRLVKSCIYKRIIVAVSDPVRNDPPVIQIKDCT